mgnify:CR=1 FL=1
MKRLFPQLASTYLLLATAPWMVGATACSSSPAEKTSDPAASIPPSLTETAKAALQDPGRQGRSYTASLESVASWTVHRGTGVTVIGKNVAGKIEVAVTWQHARTGKAAVVACATARRVTCTAALGAMASDLGAEERPPPSPSISTSSIKPLDVAAEDEDPCAVRLIELAEQADLGHIEQVSCVQGGSTLLLENGERWEGAGEDPCFIQNAANEYASVAGLAGECCGGAEGHWQDVQADSERRLLNQTEVDLLCQVDQSALISSLAPSVGP